MTSRPPTQASAGLRPASLRERAIVSLKRMLRFNNDSNGDVADRWKVLVYDAFCRDVISLLLNVGDLRGMGVTLHLKLSSERGPVSDIPAVYFCRPNDENIATISKDLEKGLYDEYHLNFTPSLPSDQLENLARHVAEIGVEENVAKVWDQCLSFVCLEEDLFSLHRPRSFAELHDPGLADSVLETTVNDITEGIFSVVATMGVVPVIRAQSGGPAEMIAIRLDKKLRNSLRQRINPFSDHGRSFTRPVLVLVDRTIDLSVMLHHTWTYQALAHDVMSLHMNRVKVTSEDGEERAFDLNPTDSFWADNVGLPFPTVAEQVEETVNEYTAEYERLTRNAGSIGEVAGQGSGDGSATEHLASAINALPQLTQKKKMIDLHASLATALLNQIRDRQLDNYFSIEENMINRGVVDVKNVKELLMDSERGSNEDKLRLALITAISTPGLTPEDRRVIGLALDDAGVDKAPWNYVLSQNSLSVSALAPPSATNPTRSTSYHSKMDKISSGILTFADKAYSKGMTSIISGMKQLLPSSKDLPITRIVDLLMDMKQSPLTANYLYLDPKLSSEASRDISRGRMPFKSSIVFAIGGGNYVEYHNLRQMAKAKGRNVLYGATEITSPNDFLSELSFLGNVL